MSAKVVPFRAVHVPPPTKKELERRVHELSVDTDNMRMDNPHVQLRLSQRGVVMSQLLDVVRNGAAITDPVKDEYGDWRIKLKRLVAGRRIQVVVAVKEDHFVVVTVI